MSASRATDLAASLQVAVEALVARIGEVSPRHWSALPAANTWSVGKDAEHVAEAMTFHLWIVRLTLGEKVSSRRPAIERATMTTSRSPREVVELIRARSAECAGQISGLTDQQLRLATRPPRAKAQTLADTIERVMIGHVRAHLADLQGKLRGLGG